MAEKVRIAITGIGVVSPVGIGRDDGGCDDRHESLGDRVRVTLDLAVDRRVEAQDRQHTRQELPFGVQEVGEDTGARRVFRLGHGG